MENKSVVISVSVSHYLNNFEEKHNEFKISS